MYIYIIWALESLNTGKLPDKSALTLEHILYAEESIHPLITMCFNAMFKHGYLPKSFMSTTITPIIKDKNGDITSSSKYKPITMLLKVIKKSLLEIIQTKLLTKDNQFWFKKQHGTDLSNLVLKKIIREYNSTGTSVFIC